MQFTPKPTRHRRKTDKLYTCPDRVGVTHTVTFSKQYTWIIGSFGAESGEAKGARGNCCNCDGGFANFGKVCRGGCGHDTHINNG